MARRVRIACGRRQEVAISPRSGTALAALACTPAQLELSVAVRAWGGAWVGRARRLPQPIAPHQDRCERTQENVSSSPKPHPRSQPQGQGMRGERGLKRNGRGTGEGERSAWHFCRRSMHSGHTAVYSCMYGGSGGMMMMTEERL